LRKGNLRTVAGGGGDGCAGGWAGCVETEKAGAGRLRGEEAAAISDVGAVLGADGDGDGDGDGEDVVGVDGDGDGEDVVGVDGDGDGDDVAELAARILAQADLVPELK